MFDAASTPQSCDWVFEILEGMSDDFPLTDSLVESLRLHAQEFYVVTCHSALVGSSYFSRLLQIATSLEIKLDPDIMKLAWSRAGLERPILQYVESSSVILEKTSDGHSFIAGLLRKGKLDASSMVFGDVGAHWALFGAT